MKQFGTRDRRAVHILALGLIVALGASACGDDETSGDAGRLVLGTLVFGTGETTSYVSLLADLGPQEVDLATATEISGLADVWVHEGDVFVTDSQMLTMTKYAIEDGLLVEEGVVGFAAYGLTAFGFSQNVFVSGTKAYMQNGVAELIVWNPETMMITGTIDVPDLGQEAGLEPFTGYTDRSSAIRDGRLYLAYYYTDATYFAFAPVSKIIVVDTATDAVVDTIDAPCPGIDHATIADDGTIYFSAWIFAPGGAAALEQPATCVFAVPETGAPSVAFTVNELLPGLEGGVFRAIGGGRALLSALDRSHAPEGSEASVIAYGDNWRFYVYEFASGTATRVESLDWNGGAQYTYEIEDEAYMLVAKGDYTETTICALGDGSTPTPIFTSPGWSIRLFDAR